MAKQKKTTKDLLTEEIMEENPDMTLEEAEEMADKQLEEEAAKDSFKVKAVEEAPKMYTEAEMVLLAKKLVENLTPGKAKPEPTEQDPRVDHLINMLEKQEGFHVKPVKAIPDDPDDLLEEPVTFFAINQSMTIWGSTKYGKTTEPPFGVPIRFSNAVRRKLQGKMRGQDSWQVVSYFTTHSKAQRDFLLAHEQYGNLIHSKPKDALNTDPLLADVKSNVMSEVFNMSAGQVIDRCRNMKITISDNIQITRGLLVDAMVKDRTEEQASQQRKNAERLADKSKNEKFVTV